MKRTLAVCVLLLLFACKREEDAPQATTSTTTTTTTTTASAMVASTGPTQLVALTQPQDSVAPMQTQTPPTPTQAPTQQTPTQNAAHVSSVVVGNVVSNGMPAESVARVVRANVPRYRTCYEAGLRANPALRGRVSMRMTIDASGALASAEDAGSDLPDQTVIGCVFGTLGTLVFPQPEAGSATATVPIVFSPPP